MTNQDSERLGRLLEAVEQMREDLRDERQVARENRQGIHRRLDEQADEVAKLRTDIKVAGQVEAQVRNELIALRATVNDNHNSIQPDIEEFRRMRTLGKGLFWLLGFGGMSLGATLAFMSEWLSTWARGWLKIP